MRRVIQLTTLAAIVFPIAVLAAVADGPPTLNLPPVNVPALRREWLRLKEELRAIPPKNLPTLDSLERMWERLRESAR